MRNPQNFPRRSMQYNDVQIHCPHCHKKIIIFGGFYENHKCYKCGAIIKDILWKSQCKKYKQDKRELLLDE